MKNLIIFLAGLLAGIAGVFFYQVFGEPALPKPALPKPATGVAHAMLNFQKYGDCGEPWGRPSKPISQVEGVAQPLYKEKRWDDDLEPGEMIF